MPANERYLSTRGQRISKTLAGIIGGYVLTAVLHLAYGAIFGTSDVWIQTTIFSFFIVWVAAMVCALLIEKAWKIWAIYLSAIAIGSILIYLLR